MQITVQPIKRVSPSWILPRMRPVPPCYRVKIARRSHFPPALARPYPGSFYHYTKGGFIHAETNMTVGSTAEPSAWKEVSVSCELCADPGVSGWATC